MRSITIIGGGLAGLTLGIALRRHDVPVTIIEGGSYPRHRVCGEFISGRGLGILTRFGITAQLSRASRVANTAAFFTGRRACGIRRLPESALCISRHALDAHLAGQFVAAGGELRTNTRWPATDWPEGYVCATGRQPAPTVAGWQWFGLKVHARNVYPETDLEMHLGPDSYVGLCRLPDGVVNVCGLFRRRPGDASRGVAEQLRGAPGSPLFERMRSAVLEKESQCAVAGLSLRRRPWDAERVRIGDAISMIPPITGNGMSMAFESAEAACETLWQFARGDLRWDEVRFSLARRQRSGFARRLFWAGALHYGLFSWAGRELLVPLAFRLPPLWQTAFELTRWSGKPNRASSGA